ncbi:hypothetical protein C427_0626 [Paraglaciecola psychrophila 170]|uniref:CpXC domain-containing protein n=1 Tax=Paraglaciecola psychrophila 170 TaxID=1129794 RepID=M4RGP5_9ALTE|nr:hypothetical protein [Paraglaciecola psychrophila]AGH42736.1 hypothetical protein C427_0626 [Paraglaciecola psychrophila 170]
MKSITWSPAAACPNCKHTFLANSFLVCELTSEQLINGPYPNINMSGNRMSCPKCGSFADVFNYTPETVKSELQKIREQFLDIKEAELAVFFKTLKTASPENYEELYSLVLEISPSLSEVMQNFKATLNWICLIGGTWAFFTQLERTLQ